MSPLPCANITFPGAAQKEPTPAAPEGNHPAAAKGPSGESWAVLPPELVPVEQSPSESSESVSLVTQIANPASVPATQLQTAAPPTGIGDLSQRLVEATLEEPSSLPKPSEAAQPSAPAEESAASSEPAAGRELRELESKGQGRTETLREEGPTDLRVFELNSDSGKSTPSNNGKKGLCGAWEPAGRGSSWGKASGFMGMEERKGKEIKGLLAEQNRPLVPACQERLCSVEGMW